MRNENDRGEDQVEVMPVSDTEQDDDRQQLKPYATDRGHFEEDVSDATVKSFIITTGSYKPSGPFRSALYCYYFLTISTVRNVPAESQTRLSSLCTHPSLLKYVRLIHETLFISITNIFDYCFF